jgi:hypothetical protein
MFFVLEFIIYVWDISFKSICGPNSCLLMSASDVLKKTHWTISPPEFQFDIGLEIAADAGPYR